MTSRSKLRSPTLPNIQPRLTTGSTVPAQAAQYQAIVQSSMQPTQQGTRRLLPAPPQQTQPGHSLLRQTLMAGTKLDQLPMQSKLS